MIVLVGDTRSSEYVALLQKLGWGRMVIDRKIKPYYKEPWGFDNGAYRDYCAGRTFDRDRYLRALEKVIEIANEYHPPYLSVLPDEVGAGMKSLDLSIEWLETELSRIDLNWYLAIQDGMKLEVVEEVLKNYPNIKGLFLGGTDRFKSTAMIWSWLAHRYGRRFHYARAGTKRKVTHAIFSKADSIDSAVPLWIRSRFRKFFTSVRRNWGKRSRLLFDELYLAELHLRAMVT